MITARAPKITARALAIFLLLLIVAPLVPLSPAFALGSPCEFATTQAELAQCLETQKAKAAGPSTFGTQYASCWQWNPPGPDITCFILTTLNYILDGIAYIPFQVAKISFMEALAYNEALFSTFDSSRAGVLGAVARLGWSVVLSIMNMLFVLILLWIAIATIFDFGPYTMRSALPSLIIAALLINFSFAIGTSFVRLGNGLGNIFLNGIASRGGIENVTVMMFNVEAVVRAVNKNITIDPNEAEKTLKNPSTTVTIRRIDGSTVPATAHQCALVNRFGEDLSTLFPGSAAVRKADAVAACATVLAKADIQLAVRSVYAADSINFILALSLLAKLLILPVALFVLLAAALFLMIRALSLMLLMVFAPFAFFSLAFPPLRTYWSQWWGYLVRWTFYLPVFLFLFYLSIVTLQTVGPLAAVQATTNEISGLGVVIAYLVGIVMMILSLVMAQKMGIAGAGMIEKLGMAAVTGGRSFLLGTGKIAAGKAAAGLLSGTGGLGLAGSRYTRWALRPLEATAAVGQRIKEQREKAARQRRALASKGSPEYRHELMQGMKSPERADFIRDMKKHEVQQVLDVMSPSQRIALHQEMKQYELDDKILEATRDLTSAVELETGIERTDARFQEAFNSWLKSATTGDIQKRVSTEDIRTNTHLHTALATQGIGELADLRTIAHTGEKAEAMRQHFIDLGNRRSFEQELTLGYTELEASERAIARAAHNLQGTNQTLANELTSTVPANQVSVSNLARSRPMGRKAGPPVIVVTTPGAPAPP